MLESYKWIGWESLQALILRAPLCGANKSIDQVIDFRDSDTPSVETILFPLKNLEAERIFQPAEAFEGSRLLLKENGKKLKGKI